MPRFYFPFSLDLLLLLVGVLGGRRVVETQDGLVRVADLPRPGAGAVPPPRGGGGGGGVFTSRRGGESEASSFPLGEAGKGKKT